MAWWTRLPALVRFVILHGAAGFGISALFVAAILWADPAGIGTLMLRCADGPWPVALLWFFSGLTFGSAQIGNAVMLLADDDPPRGGGLVRRMRTWLSFDALPALRPAKR